MHGAPGLGQIQAPLHPYVFYNNQTVMSDIAGNHETKYAPCVQQMCCVGINLVMMESDVGDVSVANAVIHYSGALNEALYYMCLH